MTDLLWRASFSAVFFYKQLKSILTLSSAVNFVVVLVGKVIQRLDWGSLNNEFPEVKWK